MDFQGIEMEEVFNPSVISPAKPVVLVVDDDEGIRDTLEAILTKDYTVIKAKDGRAALRLIDEKEVQVMLLDIRLPDINGLDVLKRVKERYDDIEVAMITAIKEVDTAVKAMKLGAYDYITKEFDYDEVVNLVRHIIEKQNLTKELIYLQSEMDQYVPHDFIMGLRDFRSMRGGILSPETCKKIDAGLSNFPGEMERYLKNTRELAGYLETVRHIEKVHYLAECPDTRNGSGAVFSISLTGASGEKKQRHEMKFFEELRKVDGPIECKTSFGDGRYGALGQSTFGWEVPDALKGVVRLSAGLGDVRLAIGQLRTVFERIYRGE